MFRTTTVLALIIIALSCKKKTTAETPFQWPEGTGEYAPYTTGSKFTYEVTTAATTDSFTYTVTKDTVMEGLKCRKLESDKPALASNVYVHYASGVRTEFNLNNSFNNIAIPLIKQEALKEATPVNATWTAGSFNVMVPAMPPTIPIPLNIVVTTTNTMLQKDFTKNILTKDYAGTYAVKSVSALPANIIALLPAGTPGSVQIDNFFSKGVGLSERTTTANTIKIKRSNVIK